MDRPVTASDFFNHPNITCPHDAWADDGPDAFGDRICAKCECKVRVVLTEAAFKTYANQQIPGTFPEID